MLVYLLTVITTGFLVFVRKACPRKLALNGLTLQTNLIDFWFLFGEFNWRVYGSFYFPFVGFPFWIVTCPSCGDLHILVGLFCECLMWCFWFQWRSLANTDKRLYQGCRFRGLWRTFADICCRCGDLVWRYDCACRGMIGICISYPCFMAT